MRRAVPAAGRRAGADEKSLLKNFIVVRWFVDSKMRRNIMTLIKRVRFTDVDGRECEVRLESDGKSYEARPFRGETPIGRIVYSTTEQELRNARWGGIDGLHSLIGLAKSVGIEISRIRAS